MKRRDFIIKTTQASAALSLLGAHTACTAKKNELFFQISLAQWSLHKSLFAKKIDHLDFAAIANKTGCTGLEYVNSFFFDKAKNIAYLNEMNSRAKAEGIENVLIMIDREGAIADSDKKKRIQTIENHYKWVDAAHHLGCHAIRVNLSGDGTPEEVANAGIESLNTLSEYAAQANINVLVENHGGLSSNGDWMQSVFSHIKNENCGTLPDFGNFCIHKNKQKECIEEYDRYKGMEQLLPFAKAVSAKSNTFLENGDEKNIDYYKIMKMVKKSGYKGFIGVEYEGSQHEEIEGIELTKNLLIKAGKLA
ncbi:TIM barrel protein [Flavicella sp.]|uniref:sugar phosphate isomerase/epimerase family protein n=1 Tax=Flavicella sp. TaxID=2957742 RepID=UPI0026225F6C|nr:TIM barrel protein [Flavicella sp.]MDG1803916.1 TIM barrel protein [Flavicella sp.]MDG2281068.1 TIM barrel protein [Flavicella sp.]